MIYFKNIYNSSFLWWERCQDITLQLFHYCLLNNFFPYLALILLLSIAWLIKSLLLVSQSWQTTTRCPLCTVWPRTWLCNEDRALPPAEATPAVCLRLSLSLQRLFPQCTWAWVLRRWGFELKAWPALQKHKWHVTQAPPIYQSIHMGGCVRNVLHNEVKEESALWT